MAPETPLTDEDKPGQGKPGSTIYRVVGALLIAGAIYLAWLTWDIISSPMDSVSRGILGSGTAIGVFFCTYIGLRFLISGRSF